MSFLRIKDSLAKRKTFFFGPWAFAFFVWLLHGCGDTRNFDQFLARQEIDETANPIFQKQYTSDSLPRVELEKLLDMALYRGPAETYGDLILRERSEKHRMDPVVFSHKSHRAMFTCRVCHVELEFAMKKGASGITREGYLDGLYCGACHNGTTAFSVEYACNLCHVKVDKQGNYVAKKDYMPSGGNLPVQEYGDGINWVEAVRQGIIAPRDSLAEEGKGPSMPLPEHLKKPLRWTTTSPRILVVFPHDSHVLWLDCANCHPDIFTIEQMGTVEFDKEKNLYGLYCGTCHMTVAFPMNGCGRCHPDQKSR